MVSAIATQPRRGLSGLLRRGLLGGLLVAAVVMGLLSMHTVNLHATPAAHASATIVAAAAGAGEAHHLAAGLHGSGGAADDLAPACSSCGGGDHLGMAMSCVLALLLVLLILTPPRLLRGWMHRPPRPLLVARSLDRLVPRAPALHVLCISRT